jgi:hypothetical protein
MAVRIFFSYSHVDETLRDQLENQLALLCRQGVVETWHDRRIGPGAEFAGAIEKEVESARIILLLVSADFLSSKYCYDIEMKRAMEKHENGQAIVIPVILRACDWHGAPFGKLNATPPDGKPITQFADRDQALLEVAKAIRVAAARLDANSRKPGAPMASTGDLPDDRGCPAPKSSSGKQVFVKNTDRDRDQFQRQTFEYLAKYFQHSIRELINHNESIDGVFRLVDADCFVAAVYKNGHAVSRCTVYTGIHDGSSQRICYSPFEGALNYRAALKVEAGNQSLYLLGQVGSEFAAAKRQLDAKSKLTQEEAAEFYWSLLMEPLHPY